MVETFNSVMAQLIQTLKRLVVEPLETLEEGVMPIGMEEAEVRTRETVEMAFTRLEEELQESEQAQSLPVSGSSLVRSSH